MSQANVDLVLRALNAVARRPEPDFETINAVYRQDHVFIPIEVNKLGGEEVRGAAGYRTWSESIAALTPWQMELGGAVDTGPATVLVVLTLRIRGARSGAAVDQRVWLVVTVEAGMITRTESYFDPTEATLKAAGRPD